EKRVEGYRNFATKLWNAARFLQMNGVGASDSIAAPEAALPVNRWIIGEVVETLAKLDRAFDDLRYDDMADAIYHFVWGTFCDWYVELVKGELSSKTLPLDGGGQGGGDAGDSSDPSGDIAPPPIPPHQGEGSSTEETRRVAAWAFDQILVMLHPLMPFITEELWSAMGERPYELIVAKWPEPEAQVDPHAKAELDWLVRLVSEVRSARTELNVPPSAKLTLFAGDVSDETAGRLDRNYAVISRLARLHSIQLSTFPGKGAAQIVVDEATFALPLEGVIDFESEKARLSKGAEAAEKERDSLAQRLANPNFTERAKPEAVDKARADHDAKAAEAERLRAALERLG
ncbi:MAG: class I tRNA ligase family protein, partial [Sphingomicrobium sp.]